MCASRASISQWNINFHSFKTNKGRCGNRPTTPDIYASRHTHGLPRLTLHPRTLRQTPARGVVTRVFVERPLLVVTIFVARGISDTNFSRQSNPESGIGWVSEPSDSKAPKQPFSCRDRTGGLESGPVRSGVRPDPAGSRKQKKISVICGPQMSTLTLGVGIGDLAFFNELSLFLSWLSFRTQLYRPFFNAAWETPSTPCLRINWPGAA
jgi:hypothetical protein